MPHSSQSPSIVEYYIISEVWNTVSSLCKTDRCKKMAQRILLSNSLRDALINVAVISLLDASNFEIPEEEAKNIAESCITEGVVNQIVVAGLMNNERLADAVYEAIATCIEQQLQV
jgi:heptaprenylglyceryl phosphate synthase